MIVGLSRGLEMDEKIDNLGLDTLPEEAVGALSSWWREWYLFVGHRRLGRMLISNRRAEEGGTNSNMPALPKRGKRLTPQEMDALAPAAKEALLKLPDRQVDLIARWWKSRCGKEGHRALGRLLVNHGGRNGAKKEGTPTISPPRQIQIDQSITGIPGHFNCRFTSSELDGAAAFSVTLQGGGLWIVLNKLHPIYPLWAPLADGDLQEKRDLDAVALLLRAWAHTEIIRHGGAAERCAVEAREHWGRMLRDLLHAQSDELTTRANG